MRENVAAKGRRYLAEGRITVRRVSSEAVVAIARGRGAWYSLGFDNGRGWWCNCPARSHCCHLEALELVTVSGGVR